MGRGQTRRGSPTPTVCGVTEWVATPVPGTGSWARTRPLETHPPQLENLSSSSLWYTAGAASRPIPHRRPLLRNNRQRLAPPGVGRWPVIPRQQGRA